MSKYLEFQKDDIVKTIWILNKRTKERLGVLNYFPKWKCYVFSGKSSALFDSECLQEVIDKLDELNKENKNE